MSHRTNLRKLKLKFQSPLPLPYLNFRIERCLEMDLQWSSTFPIFLAFTNLYFLVILYVVIETSYSKRLTKEISRFCKCFEEYGGAMSAYARKKHFRRFALPQAGP